MGEKLEIDIKRKSRKFLYFSAFMIYIVSFIIGYTSTWPSPVNPKLQQDNEIFGRPLTNDEIPLLTSIVTLGATVGPLPGGILADTIGRKTTLLIFSISLSISYIILTFADIIELYYLSRFVIGASLGVYYTILPMYIAEIAENSNKGKLNCLNTTFVSMGCFFTYSVGPYVDVRTFNIVLSVFPVLFILILYFFIPETPAYLVQSNMYHEARLSLKKFRDGDLVDEELTGLTSRKTTNGSVLRIMKEIIGRPDLLNGMAIVIFLMALQQATCYTVLLVYSQTIFEKSKVDLSPEIPPIISSAVQLISSVSASLVVEKLGRKLLMFVSTVGTLVSLLSLGACFNFYGSDFVPTWLPIVSIIVHIASYNFGLYPVPYAVIADIFPSDVMSLASSVSVTISLVFAFLCVQYFPLLESCFGMGWAFWLFAGLTAVGIVLFLCYVPETKKVDSEVFEVVSKI